MTTFLDALKPHKTPSKIEQAAKESILRLQAASRTQVAESHRRQYRHGLEQISHVKIEVGNEGLMLSTPMGDRWYPDDANATDFATLPIAFAQAYLQLRLRNFLCETVCQTGVSKEDHAIETLSLSQNALEDGLTLAANDRIGGGLHVGILQQFAQSNRGEGYFHPGWQVIREEEDGAVAVQNYGITIHIQRERYLRPEERNAQRGDVVSIWMPGHRFESEVYVAIGDCGPVPEERPAIDIYLAVPATAVGPVMTQLTTRLNEHLHLPFTLKAPYRPEGYEGPEAMVLRIQIADYTAVLPVLQQIAEHCQAIAPSIFACPLLPGISFACRIGSGVSSRSGNSANRWYGSSADLSRLDAIATALVSAWYQTEQSPTPADNLAAIQTEFAHVGFDWESPYWTMEASGGAVGA